MESGRTLPRLGPKQTLAAASSHSVSGARTTTTPSKRAQILEQDGQSPEHSNVHWDISTSAGEDCVLGTKDGGVSANPAGLDAMNMKDFQNPRETESDKPNKEMCKKKQELDLSVLDEIFF
jgi:hypothetical protein